jgi:hypothetical protein
MPARRTSLARPPTEAERERPPAHQPVGRPREADRILALQRAAGNQAVARWFAKHPRTLIQRSPASWTTEAAMQSVATYDGSTQFWQPLRRLVTTYGQLHEDELGKREKTLDALTKAIAAWRGNQAKNWWDSATDKAKAAIVGEIETLVAAEHADLDRKERARAGGEAGTALETAGGTAASRADADHDAALLRLERDLGVDSSQVEDLLRKSLLALARAPLTINFDHRKLQLILGSGGFKNYWQINRPLPEPDDAASPEDQQKYAYQQKRLEGEHRLFGGTADVNVKKQRADEQAISTGANVSEFHLGAAPTLDYGRSVAVLRDRIKQRATYTPYDALDLIKKIEAGEAFVGPEVVGTHANLAAIIRYAPTEALRDIIKKAQDPQVRFDLPMANYVEAQIHGPVTVGDIERITIALDDVEDDAYESLFNANGKQPANAALKGAVNQLKLTIQQSLATHGIAVEFGSMM